MYKNYENENESENETPEINRTDDTIMFKCEVQKLSIENHRHAELGELCRKYRRAQPSVHKNL